MKLKTIEKLCCPFDKQDLQLQVLAKDTDENVLDGILSCESCRRNYPIIYGVPVMAPNEYRQTALEQPLLDRWELEYGMSPVKLLP